MEQEDAVITPAETTAPVESAPIETETADAQPTPVEESSQPEKKVSDSVPYERFKEVNDRLKDLEAQTQRSNYVAESNASDEVPFDEPTLQGLEKVFNNKIQQELEVRDAQKFVRTYADDLKDPFVDARTKDLIRQGFDREQALQTAKSELEGRFTTKSMEAKASGVQEGQKLANKKEAYGAIGMPGSSEKVDPSKLTASEFAKYYGLPKE